MEKKGSTMTTNRLAGRQADRQVGRKIDTEREEEGLETHYIVTISKTSALLLIRVHKV